MCMFMSVSDEDWYNVTLLCVIVCILLCTSITISGENDSHVYSHVVTKCF